MCNRLITLPLALLEELVNSIEAGLPASVMDTSTGDEPSVYPSSEMAVILYERDRLVLKLMRWGYRVSWSKQVLFNTRFDTALRPDTNMWADSLMNRRCVVPASGFFEPHASETVAHPRTGKPSRQQYLFTLLESPLFFLAGIYENDCFSIMTTEPNDSVRSIHDRMPVVLQPDELHTWLLGDYLQLANRDALTFTAIKANPTPVKEPETLAIEWE